MSSNPLHKNIRIIIAGGGSSAGGARRSQCSGAAAQAERAARRAAERQTDSPTGRGEARAAELLGIQAIGADLRGYANGSVQSSNSLLGAVKLAASHPGGVLADWQGPGQRLGREVVPCAQSIGP